MPKCIKVLNNTARDGRVANHCQCVPLKDVLFTTNQAGQNLLFVYYLVRQHSLLLLLHCEGNFPCHIYIYAREHYIKPVGTLLSQCVSFFFHVHCSLDRIDNIDSLAFVNHSFSPIWRRPVLFQLHGSRIATQ